MAIKTVNWNNSERLACMCCVPAAVQLQIGVNDVIPATLVHAIKLSKCGCGCAPCGCSNAVYQYSFTYDEDVLPGDATSITQANISGVLCMGALTTWVQQQIGLATRPTIWTDEVHEPFIDFLAPAPNNSFEDIDYVVTNPSALRPATAIISWRWNFVLWSTEEFGFNGISGYILVDGVVIPGHSTHDANFSNQEAGIGAVIDAQGGGGSYAIELQPSQSKTFTLRLEKNVSALPEPDTAYAAQDIAISVLGITT